MKDVSKKKANEMKALNESDIRPARKQEDTNSQEFELRLWKLMLAKHNLGGDMPAIIFYI